MSNSFLYQALSGDIEQPYSFIFYLARFIDGKCCTLFHQNANIQIAVINSWPESLQIADITLILNIWQNCGEDNPGPMQFPPLTLPWEYIKSIECDGVEIPKEYYSNINNWDFGMP